MNRSNGAQPIFIVGVERSGTTMLRLMLNEHPDIAIPRESWFLIDLMDSLPRTGTLNDRQRERAIQLMLRHPRWRDMDIDDREFAERVRNLSLPTLADVIETVYRIHLLRTGKTRWGDKTPGYLIEIDRLRQVFPRAQFIHLIRDARDVSLSLWRKGWFGPHLRNATRHWAETTRTGIEQGRRLPPDCYHEVRYEDLVREPDKQLRSVCRFLELDYAPEMMQFYRAAARNVAPWQRMHHEKTLRAPLASDVQPWRRTASMFQLVVIEGLAGNSMELVGQKRHVRGWRAGLARLAWVAEQAFYGALALRRRLIRGLHPGPRTAST